MALVHSLWTKPILNNERSIDANRQIESVIWCYASSVAYAKRLGEPIYLYTDEFGRELLGFLPYDRVELLDVPEIIPTDFWAAGKFYAYQKMDIGDVHIDGDVFIKKQKLLDTIKFGLRNNDLIIQSVENNQAYKNQYYLRCIELLKSNNIVFRDITSYYTPAYNCGLIGFNNAELKDKYINHYLQSIERICCNSNAMQQIRNQKDTWMDLILEQQHLYSLAQDYNVYNLLGEGDNVNYNACKLGYQHLLGSDKWERLEDIQAQLECLDPKMFQMIIEQYYD